MPKSFSTDPKLLRPNGFNTNHVSPENEEKLIECVKQFGLFKPIVVREIDDGFGSTVYEIIGGEHRWQAAHAAGLTEVPVFNLGPIPDDKAKKISLADNARYGADDTIELGRLMEELGSAEDFQSYLPYTETDVRAIFAATDIALDDLELDPGFEEKHDQAEEPAAAKAPKTHTIMRFKVPLGDAERLTEMIAKTQKRQGFADGDELTRAGDALVHLLLGGAAGSS